MDEQKEAETVLKIRSIMDKYPSTTTPVTFRKSSIQYPSIILISQDLWRKASYETHGLFHKHEDALRYIKLFLGLDTIDWYRVHSATWEYIEDRNNKTTRWMATTEVVHEFDPLPSGNR